MEHKICPILGSGPVEINSNCKMEHCALWVKAGAEGRCAIAVIAEEMRSASAGVDRIADNLDEANRGLPAVVDAVKGLV